MAAHDSLPARTRVYQNFLLDSPRWDSFKPRVGDVVISTSYKAGTTWTQTIVGMLIFGRAELPKPLRDLSPWFECALPPPGEAEALIKAQDHRRFIKSHLPLDALPYDPRIRYISVTRDGRDVAMSLWHHLQNYADGMIDKMNSREWNQFGRPHPPLPESFADFWEGWVSRGSFPWEADGYPYWSHHHHLKSWWPYRDLPNVLMLHYGDMLADLPGEVRRIADFLEITLPEATLDAIAEATTFTSMKSQAAHNLPGDESSWRDHRAFFNKGVNGRWREALSDGDLADYDAAVARSLTPDAAAWLYGGRRAPISL